MVNPSRSPSESHHTTPVLRATSLSTTPKSTGSTGAAASPPVLSPPAFSLPSPAAVQSEKQKRIGPADAAATAAPKKKRIGFIHAVGVVLAILLARAVAPAAGGGGEQEQQLSYWLLILVRYFTALLFVWASFLFSSWMIFMRPGTTTRTKPLRVDGRLLLSASELSCRLRHREFTSVALTEAFIRQIEAMDKHMRVVQERRYDVALQEAREADRILDEQHLIKSSSSHFGDDAAAAAAAATSLPPFLGIPCSIKESFALEGCIQSSNHFQRHGTRAEADAPSVARYRNAGFIPVVTTSTSEFCMWLESIHKSGEYSCNPHDATRIVGGSSGGEAAALAASFVPVGLGGSFLGSLHLPSMFCGTWTLKPSPKLGSANAGQMPVVSGKGHSLAVVGPMARHAEDLYPLFKIISTPTMNEEKKQQQQQQQQPQCDLATMLSRDFLEANQPSAATPLLRDRVLRDPSGVEVKTLFVLEDLCVPTVTVDDAQKQALRTVASRLAAQTGAKIFHVDLRDSSKTPPGWEKLRTHLIQIVVACATANEKEFWEDEIRQAGGGGGASSDPVVSSAPVELLKWSLGISHHSFPAIGLGVLEAVLKRVAKDEKKNSELIAMSHDLRQAVGTALGEDGVLLLPTYPTAAPLHSSAALLSPAFMYCAMVNALQLPSSHIPVWLHDSGQRLPLGIQCVAPNGEDARSLRFAMDCARLLPDICKTKPLDAFEVIHDHSW